MNDLSWLIYIASVVDSITFVAVLGCIFGVVGFLFPLASISDDGNSVFKSLLLVFLICFTIGSGTVGALIPNKDTIYMIGASEATERGFDKLVELSEEEGTLVNLGIEKIKEKSRRFNN